MDFKVSKNRATLRERVEEKLRDAIRSGHFLPGQRLVERELCEMLDVSRTSIRESIRQLEAEGLITVVPHKGPVVTSMSKEEAKQLYELRALLEGYAGEQLASHGSPEIKERLGHALASLDKVAREAGPEDLLAGKADFYDLLLEGAGNVYVRQTLEGLYNRIALLRKTSMAQPGRLEHSMHELHEIVKAIQAGNAPAAGKACRNHIHNAAAAALSAM